MSDDKLYEQSAKQPHPKSEPKTEPKTEPKPLRQRTVLEHWLPYLMVLLILNQMSNFKHLTGQASESEYS